MRAAVSPSLNRDYNSWTLRGRRSTTCGLCCARLRHRPAGPCATVPIPRCFRFSGVVDKKNRTERQVWTSNQPQPAEDQKAARPYPPLVAIVWSPERRQVKRYSIASAASAAALSATSRASHATASNGETVWTGHRFAVVDTGASFPDPDRIEFPKHSQAAGVAITEAWDARVGVDVRAGMTPLDEELARLLRTTDKPVTDCQPIGGRRADSKKTPREFHRFRFRGSRARFGGQGDGVAAALLDAHRGALSTPGHVTQCASY